MGAVALLAFVLAGVGVDVASRRSIERSAFQDTQRAADDWIASMNSPTPGPPITSSDVPYLQLVDSLGNVVAATRPAGGRKPMSLLWPTFEEQHRNRVECARGRCLLVSARRVPPERAIVLWEGRTHVVYAAKPRPPLLASHRLEFLVALGALAATGLTGWTLWWLSGRALRPVEAMRGRIAEITISDLSRRLPQPPGDDAIARLTRTANQALARLEDAAERQRHFGSVVSHELRRPLTGLRMQLEETLLYPEADPRPAVEEALATTDRLTAIIEEMLELTRIGTGPRAVEAVDLAALAREEIARQADGPPVRIDADREVTVLGNRVQLAGVLTNLVGNAKRHANSGIRVTVARADGQATVTVLDDGAGIAPDDRERVFQPFVRLREGRRREPGGSGLGLAICRAVAEAHNGTLRVEDSERGARFVLRLPLAPP